MAVHLFSLRGVDEEEAEQIRNLLSDNNIDFYETPAGNWGISAPALWLRNKEDLPRAKSLLDDFHQNWSDRQRDKYQQLRQAGELPGFIDALRQNPLKILVYLGIVILILYLSIKPFISIGK